jgi:hypothetical protein
LHVGGPLEHQPFVGHLEPRLRHNDLQAALRRRDRDRPAGPRIVNERGGRPFCTISIETRLLNTRKPSCAAVPVRFKAPASLSSALCRPTSSRTINSYPARQKAAA